MIRFAAIFLCVALLALTGCTAVPGDAPLSTAPTAPDGDPSEEQLFALLFDIENKITLRLDMTDAELAKMQADYDKYDRNGGKSPIYRRGDLHVTVTTPTGSAYACTVDDVGVRMKGNTSRTDFYSQDEGIYNVIHLKLSFQETFDDPDEYGSDALTWTESERDERKDRTFAKLEKLDLRWNRCDDGTYLKEYFAFHSYRQNGVPAPHTNLASFDWAGIHMGVFTINEPIDKVFLAKNLPEEALGGDLYKVGWAGSRNGSFTNTDSIGIENEASAEFYAYDLKTNKKSSDHQSLIQLIQKLNSGEMTQERFAELVDTDSFLPYCAVSYLLGNPDDMRNNYNNFYIYFRGDNGKAMIIPYDYDRCLGITTHWNPTGNGVTADNPFTTKQLATNEDQENPLILYSVAAGGFYVREYALLLEQIARSSDFSLETFNELYEIAEANYARDAKPGKAFRNTDGLFMEFDLDRTSDFSSNGNISMKEYLDAKLGTLDWYLDQVDTYASKEPFKPESAWYIRSSLTDWQCDEAYRMTEDGGKPTFMLTLRNQTPFKVYNQQQDDWFGSECVGDENTVPFETDSHTNIILPAGTYHISMDPVTGTITLERIEKE